MIIRIRWFYNQLTLNFRATLIDEFPERIIWVKSIHRNQDCMCHLLHMLTFKNSGLLTQTICKCWCAMTGQKTDRMWETMITVKIMADIDRYNNHPFIKITCLSVRSHFKLRNHSSSILRYSTEVVGCKAPHRALVYYKDQLGSLKCAFLGLSSPHEWLMCKNLCENSVVDRRSSRTLNPRYYPKSCVRRTCTATMYISDWYNRSEYLGCNNNINLNK
jgi:hypothetical protein